MFIIILVLVVIVMVIDFMMMQKEDWRKSAIYLSIAAMSTLVYVVHKMQIFNKSPLEMLIKKMEPLTMWLENVFK